MPITRTWAAKLGLVGVATLATALTARQPHANQPAEGLIQRAPAIHQGTDRVAHGLSEQAELSCDYVWNTRTHSWKRASEHAKSPWDPGYVGSSRPFAVTLANPVVQNTFIVSESLVGSDSSRSFLIGENLSLSVFNDHAYIQFQATPYGDSKGTRVIPLTDDGHEVDGSAGIVRYGVAEVAGQIVVGLSCDEVATDAAVHKISMPSQRSESGFDVLPRYQHALDTSH